MLDLSKYIGVGAKIGENVQIWVAVGFYYHLGDGVFKNYEDHHVIFDGEIKCIFYTGPLSLDVKVIGDNNMDVIVNGNKAESAVYKVEGNVLKIDVSFGGGKKAQITSQIVGSQTFITAMGASVHLAKGSHR